MAMIPLTEGGPPDGGNYEYAWAGAHMQVHFLSDVGKKRKKNEDSCILCAPEADALRDKRGMLFAVADGMGGASAGERASRMGLEILIEEYYAQRTGDLGQPIPARLRTAISEANRRIFEEAEAHTDRQGMGTTMSVVVVDGEYAYIAQVGDSRVYVARGRSGLVQITDDHSLVAEQVRNGYLSEEEARNHSLRNLITRAVGIKDSVNVDLFALRLERDDTLLVCSDGLSNLIKDDEIGRALNMGNLQAAARLLVGRALHEGGTDNITAALLRVVQSPPRRELQPGAQEVMLPAGGVFGRFRNLLRRAR